MRMLYILQKECSFLHKDVGLSSVTADKYYL